MMRLSISSYYYKRKITAKEQFQKGFDLKQQKIWKKGRIEIISQVFLRQEVLEIQKKDKDLIQPDFKKLKI